MEQEHRDLRMKFLKKDEFICDALEASKDVIGFSKAWAPLAQRYPGLCGFAGGLATVYPGTSRVESDFSIMNWEKDVYRSSLMDLSLEGIMHSKQFEKLQKLNSSEQ
jgi:hypothetical protein